MPLRLSGSTGVSGIDGTAQTPSSQGANTSAGIFFPTSNTVGIATSTSERLRIDSSGYVGIGTTTPQRIFEIAASEPTVNMKRTDGASNEKYWRWYQNSSSMKIGAVDDAFTAGADWLEVTRTGNSITSIQFKYGSSSTESMRINSVGNIGIGTSSPGAQFHLANAAGAGNIYALIDSSLTSNGYNAATLYKNDQRMFRVGVLGTVGGFTNGALVVYDETAAEWRMVIDSNGNLLVGTTSTYTNNARLNVLQTVSNSAINTGAVIATGYSGDAGQAALYIGKYDNVNTTGQLFIRFQVNNKGNGCGQINGNGASAAAFGSYSDERLKENIVPLPSQLANILALKPSEFDYKDGSGHQIGFIAQDMKEVYPDVVNEGDEGMLVITGWSKTEARLVKAIQELKAEFDAYKASHP